MCVCVCVCVYVCLEGGLVYLECTHRCINFVYSLSNLGSPKGIGSPLDPPESIERKKKTYIFQVIPCTMKRV